MNESAESRDLSGIGDFTLLASESEYSRYFAQLQRVCRYLVDVYPVTDPQSAWESAMVRGASEALLRSVGLLRYKYAFAPADERRLWVDTTESGFPNQMEFSELETDVETRGERLRDLPALQHAKHLLVDALLAGQAEPTHILRQLSQRTYFERLKRDELFLPFNFDLGRYVQRGDTISHLAFSCFDFATNRPYLHFLTFEHRAGENPLDASPQEAQRLLAALRAEGSRAPKVGVLAMSLDESLVSVRVKVLKRLCIGPLYSKVLIEHRVENPADQEECYFRALLDQHGREAKDFVLLLTEETVFSSREEQSRSFFSGQGKVRQVFAVNYGEPECAERQASFVQHFYLMPHELLQHVEPGKASRVTHLSQARKFAVDDSGEVHGL